MVSAIPAHPVAATVQVVSAATEALVGCRDNGVHDVSGGGVWVLRLVPRAGKHQLLAVLHALFYLN